MKRTKRPVLIILTCLLAFGLALAVCFIDLPSLGQGSLESILESIKLPQGLQVSVQSVDRRIFRGLEASQAAVYQDGKLICTVELARLKSGLLDLLLGRVGSYDIELQGVQIHADLDSLLGMKMPDSSSKPLNLSIKASDIGLDVLFEGYRVEAFLQSFSLKLDSAAVSFSAKASWVNASGNDMLASLSGLDLDYNDNGLEVKLAEASLSTPSIKIDLGSSSLSDEGGFASLGFVHVSGPIEASCASIKADYEDKLLDMIKDKDIRAGLMISAFSATSGDIDIYLDALNAIVDKQNIELDAQNVMASWQAYTATTPSLTAKASGSRSFISLESFTLTDLMVSSLDLSGRAESLSIDGFVDLEGPFEASLRLEGLESTGKLGLQCPSIRATMKAKDYRQSADLDLSLDYAGLEMQGIGARLDGLHASGVAASLDQINGEIAIDGVFITKGLENEDDSLGARFIAADFIASSDAGLELQGSMSLESSTRAFSTVLANMDFSAAIAQEIHASISMGSISSGLFADSRISVNGALVLNDETSQASLDFNVDDGLEGLIKYDLGSGDARLSLSLDSFHPYGYLKNIEAGLAAFASNFLDSGTSIDGYLELSNRTAMAFEGEADFNLDFKGLAIGNSHASVNAAFDGSYRGLDFEIRELGISTPSYRISYDGSFSASELIGKAQGTLTEGKLNLVKTSDQSIVAEVLVSISSDNFISARLQSPLVKDAALDLEVKITDAPIISMSAQVINPISAYPIDISLDRKALSLTARSEGLRLDASLVDGSLLKLQGVLLNLGILGGKASGYMALDFNFDSFLFNASLSSFTFSDIFRFSGKLDLSLDTRSLLIPAFTLKYDKLDALNGTLKASFPSFADLISTLSFKDFDLAMNMSDAAGSKSMVASYKDSKLLLQAEGLRAPKALGLGIDGMLDLSILADFSKSIFTTFQFIGSDLAIRADLETSSQGMTISSLKASMGSTDIDEGFVKLDLGSWDLDAGLSISHAIDRVLNDDTVVYSSSMNLSASLLDWARSCSLDKAVKSIQSKNLGLKEILGIIEQAVKGLRKPDVLETVLELSDISLGSFRSPDEKLAISYADDAIAVAGSMINGLWRASDGYVQLSIDPSIGFVGLSLSGYAASELDLSVSIKDLDCTMINQILDFPAIAVEKCLASADAVITGPIGDPSIFATVFCDEMDISLFWLPDTLIRLSSLSVSVQDHEIFTPRIKCQLISKSGRQPLNADFLVSCTLDHLDIPLYSLELTTNGDVLFHFPFTEIGMDIESYVNGDFYIRSDGTGPMKLGCKMACSDARLDFTLPDDLPSWCFQPTDPVDCDLDLLLGQNVSFAYPASENPVLNLSVDPNQSLKIKVNGLTNAVFFSGDLVTTSGNIYYFSKDFSVVDGAIRFSEDPFDSSKMSQLFFDLQARVRDYDLEGNRVDIYLILQNVSIDSIENINPRFTSIPAKTQNEILELLGQSIISADAMSSFSVSSMASITYSAAEAIGKLGLIDTFGSNDLANTLKTTLGLDMLSFRSSIIQNLVFDILPGSFLSDSLSPLAKYLNGTAIYISKELGDQVYLQASITLKAGKLGSSAFLSQDLGVDIEMSVDWENEMGTFSIFSQPSELSVYNLFDTIGFSVSKRLEF